MIKLQATELPQAILERDLAREREYEALARAYELDARMRGLDPEDLPVRFFETFDGSKVEVRGQDSVRGTRDESAGEIVIRTRDAFVRIKLADKKN